MKNSDITPSLQAWSAGKISIQQLLSKLEEYYFSRRYLADKAILFDSKRKTIAGISEAVLASGKTAEQIAAIVIQILAQAASREQATPALHEPILITKLSLPQWNATTKILRSCKLGSPALASLASGNSLPKTPSTAPHHKENHSLEKEKPPADRYLNPPQEAFPQETFQLCFPPAKATTTTCDTLDPQAGPVLTYDKQAMIASTATAPDVSIAQKDRAPVGLLCAGTSDWGLLRETELCLQAMGIVSKSYADIGIAGLGRLLGKIDEIEVHQMLVVIAGMEAALASVLCSISTRPIVAVPSSNGYGANFSGISALLGLLNSCSPGISVVNIDGGYPAAAVVAKTLHSLKS